MGLIELIVASILVYTILGVISVLIYNSMNDVDYKMETFEVFIVWLFWPIMIILFIAYFLFNIKNGFVRIFKNTKNLFKR